MIFWCRNSANLVWCVNIFHIDQKHIFFSRLIQLSIGQKSLFIWLLQDSSPFFTNVFCCCRWLQKNAFFSFQIKISRPVCNSRCINQLLSYRMKKKFCWFLLKKPLLNRSLDCNIVTKKYLALLESLRIFRK